MSAGVRAVETLASPTRAAARTALDETIEMDEQGHWRLGLPLAQSGSVISGAAT
jgi:hypothetical protein